MREVKQVFFMSFGSLHTGKNLGCCLIEVGLGEDPNANCAELGIMPHECNQARGYLLPANEVAEQGLVIGKFYSREEMEKRGFETA